METFFISALLVAIGEIGDKTQLLSIVLATRLKKPLPIILGMVSATLLNHAVAGMLGSWMSGFFVPQTLNIILGILFILTALWLLKEDSLKPIKEFNSNYSVYFTSLTAFFIAEIGDKTQIITMELAARFHNLLLVVLGTTSGILLVNVPVILLGNAFAEKLPLKAIRYSAAALMAFIGIVTLVSENN